MKKMFTSLMLFSSISLMAAPIKVGVLVPDGSGWAKNIKKMTSEIKEATKGNVEFKIYYGGSQGDEQDVLRKIRIGQLHGGIFTGKTLGDISGEVRVMEIPFNFNSNRDKALKTLKALTPAFSQKLEQQNFKTLAIFEIGQVYLVSLKKITNLNEARSLKIWSWDGDPLVSTFIESMNFTGVPLALPDVLSSLSTGVVEAAYAPGVGILALQWNTKVKYLIDFPIGYSVGAFLVSNKEWAKISPADQKVVMDISTKYQEELNAGNGKDNEDALKAMKAQGIEFVKFSDADIKTAQGFRAQILKKLKGKLFSEEIYKKLEAEIAKK